MMMHLNLQVMKNRPLSELVIDFINDQDVNELSKKTYNSQYPGLSDGLYSVHWNSGP